MAMMRYQPNTLLEQFSNEIDRMFGRGASGFPALAGGQWSPVVDVRETENAYNIEAEVPGVDPKEIEITLDKGVLTLKGERHQTSEKGEEGAAHYVERTYGSFMRRLSLPDTVDQDNIEARAEHGVLKLVIKKKPTSQPRRIEIQD